MLGRELSCGLQVGLWVLQKLIPPHLSQVFTCSACPEVFKRRMELRLHMVSHTGEMPYKVSRACIQHPYGCCWTLAWSRGKTFPSRAAQPIKS